MIAEANAADAEYLRTVLPVLADYLRHIVDGADLDRLQRVARLRGTTADVALLDGLIAARDAAKRKPEPIALRTAQEECRVMYL